MHLGDTSSFCAAALLVVGQVKFPNFSRTPPQNLQMVNLVWVNAKKTDLKASNQPRFGHLHFLKVKLQYKRQKN